MAEIKKAQLAKIVGMKRQGVYLAVTRGKLIANTSGLIDTQNATNMKWIQKHGVSEKDINHYLVEIQEKSKNKQKVKPISNPIPKIRKKIKQKEIEIDSDKINTIQSYIETGKTQEEINFENRSGLPSEVMDLKLFELVERYGGPMMLTDWSLILNRLMTARLTEQKIQERRLELIEKDFVISRLISYLEILNKQLFDYSESAPIQIISMVKSGGENIEFEIKKNMRKEFSILIKDAKEKINQELDNLKSKHEKINGNSDN